MESAHHLPYITLLDKVPQNLKNTSIYIIFHTDIRDASYSEVIFQIVEPLKKYYFEMGD